MSENPYEPTAVSPDIQTPIRRNTIARIGFALSFLGFLSLWSAGLAAELDGARRLIGLCLPFLCLPGFFLSVIGMFIKPRAPAGWGVILGMIGSLYLPTIWMSIRFVP